jgi:hypothetical protein
MGLLRSIIHGFGFELGAQAARKAVQEVEEHLQEPPAKEGPLHRLRRRWADRRRARAEARAKNKRRTAVEQQLRALKKKNKEKSR